MTGVKECLLLQADQEKLDLVRQAKRDLFKEIAEDVKDLEDLSKKLEIMLIDDDLKKEIHDEINKEKEEAKMEALAIEREREKAQEIKKLDTERKSEPVVKSSVKKSVSSKKEKPVEVKEIQELKESKSSGMESFEYTLDQIEKKLAELKRD